MLHFTMSLSSWLFCVWCQVFWTGQQVDTTVRPQWPNRWGRSLQIWEGTIKHKIRYLGVVVRWTTCTNEMIAKLADTNSYPKHQFWSITKINFTSQIGWVISFSTLIYAEMHGRGFESLKIWLAFSAFPSQLIAVHCLKLS